MNGDRDGGWTAQAKENATPQKLARFSW